MRLELEYLQYILRSVHTYVFVATLPVMHLYTSLNRRILSFVSMCILFGFVSFHIAYTYILLVVDGTCLLRIFFFFYMDSIPHSVVVQKFSWEFWCFFTIIHWRNTPLTSERHDGIIVFLRWCYSTKVNGLVFYSTFPSSTLLFLSDFTINAFLSL